MSKFNNDILEITENITDDKVSFFVFGCWNNKQLATQKIIEKINENGSYKLGVVCGDNIYPTKHEDSSGNKIKNYSSDKIRSGFDILRSFNGNVYMGLGNHEVDDNDKCDVLNDQVSNSTNNVVLPNNYYSIKINKNNRTILKIIVIDTNLLESNECYGQINQSNINNMVHWLNNELRSDECIKIVVGHYPMYYFKIVSDSNNEQKQIFKRNNVMDPIYDTLINYEKRIYYLCADVHNYQFIIHKNINQCISGTGGAIQDKINISNDVYQFDVGDEIFNLIEIDQKYGYLSVTVIDNFATVKFNKIELEVDIKEVKKDKKKKNKLGGSYEYKYLKYKEKYLKHKKNMMI